MPTDRVIFPTLNAPVLVFAEKDLPWSECIKAELDEITEYMVRHRARLERIPDKKFRGIMERARRLHLQRVELALGFRWPQDPPGWTEFPT